jgi:hypothetical protein
MAGVVPAVSGRSEGRRSLAMFKSFLAVLAIFAAGPAVGQQKESGPYVEPQTGVAFPDALGPLKREQAHKYDRPELGVSIRYTGAGPIKADVYVYDLGRTGLGRGTRSPAVKDAFQQAQGALFLMEKRRYYQDVKKLSEDKTALDTPSGKLAMLRAAFQYRQARRAGVDDQRLRTSYLLLTAYKDKYLKVRFTYVDQKDTKGEEALNAFLTALGKALR